MRLLIVDSRLLNEGIEHSTGADEYLALLPATVRLLMLFRWRIMTR